MVTSESDVLDKYSILAMKKRHDADIIPLFMEYEKEATKIAKKLCMMNELTPLVKLIESNSKIWVLEATIRNEFAADPANQGTVLTLEAIGRASIAIREHNSLRIAAKAEIDKLFGHIPEKKIDHASMGVQNAI